MRGKNFKLFCFNMRKYFKYWWRGLAVVIIVLVIASCARDKIILHNNLASLQKRALVLVVEDDDTTSFSEYENYKNFINPIFAFLFKVDKKDLDSKTLPQIIDDYGEDHISARFKKAAQGYGKTVILTDERASYGSFKQTLSSLNRQGYIADILLDLHGSGNSAWFYQEGVVKERIVKDLSGKKLSIGFVYQTLCYGKGTMKTWVNIGAKAVNGSKSSNAFTVLSPERFLHYWVRGVNFQEAVNKAYGEELFVWKIINMFLPEFQLYEELPEATESSRMFFAGDEKYTLSS